MGATFAPPLPLSVVLGALPRRVLKGVCHLSMISDFILRKIRSFCFHLGTQEKFKRACNNVFFVYKLFGLSVFTIHHDYEWPHCEQATVNNRKCGAHVTIKKRISWRRFWALPTAFFCQLHHAYEGTIRFVETWLGEPIGNNDFIVNIYCS